MPESLRRLVEQLRTAWGNLQPVQRAVVAGGVIVVLASIVLFSSLALRTDYQPLFTNLTSEDAGRVVEKLKERGVPYRLEQGGKAVLVPREQVYEMRLSLASEGLPAGGGIGFEIFDQTRWDLTEFTQRVNFVRALQTELQRTVTQLEPVENARVHIVLPEPQLFEEQQEEPTASVVLGLKPYARLEDDQIRGIAHLVSRAVEGLKPENIEIIDLKGNVLSDRIRAPLRPGKITEEQQQITRAFEKGLEKQIETMLGKVLGPGQAVARVSAVLDFDQAKVESETFQPVVGEEGIVRSEQTTEEKFEGTGIAPGGVPGVSSNVPGYPGSPTGDADYQRREEIKNYEISRVVEQVSRAPGAVRRLSVAVVVNTEALEDRPVDDVRSAVFAAAGINEERGDTIEVVSMPFSTKLADERDRELAARRRRELIFWGIATFLGLAMILWLYLMLRPKRPAVDEFLPQEAIPIRQFGESLEPTELPEIGRRRVGVAEPAPAAEEAVPEEEKKIRLLQQEVEKAFVEKPKEVAQLLRTWMTEE